MRTLTVTLAALLPMATPALAHPGAHMNPHGSEPWIVIMSVLLIVATALFAWGRR